MIWRFAVLAALPEAVPWLHVDAALAKLHAADIWVL